MQFQCKHGIAGIILALSFAAPVTAGPVDDGEAAYQRGNYASALRLWRPAAERGNARAQFNLGIMYNNGNGVPKDYATAHKWFSRAAAQGDETAAEYRDLVAPNIVPLQEAGVQRRDAGVQSGEAAYQSGNYSTALSAAFLLEIAVEFLRGMLALDS